MKLRHHRKRKSVLMLRRARVHGFIASAARGFASFMDRMLADRIEKHMLDALKYGPEVRR